MSLKTVFYDLFFIKSNKILLLTKIPMILFIEAQKRNLRLIYNEFLAITIVYSSHFF